MKEWIRWKRAYMQFFVSLLKNHRRFFFFFLYIFTKAQNTRYSSFCHCLACILCCTRRFHFRLNENGIQSKHLRATRHFSFQFFPMSQLNDWIFFPIAALGIFEWWRWWCKCKSQKQHTSVVSITAFFTSFVCVCVLGDGSSAIRF